MNRFLQSPHLPIRRPVLMITLFSTLVIFLFALPINGSPLAAQAVTETATPTPAPTLIPILGRVPITASNGTQVKQLMQIGSGQATDACWSPDGKTIGVTSTIGLELYDPAHHAKPERQLGPAADLSHCSWSPQSNYVTIINDNISTLNPWSAQIWEVINNSLYKSFNNVIQVIWSPNGLYFATLDTDKHGEIWDAVTGVSLARFSAQTILWSANNRYAAILDQDYVIRVWSADSKSVFIVNDTDKWIHLAWSPSGQALAAMSVNGQVGLISLAPAPSEFDRLSPDGFTDFSWSPDSTQIATVGHDNTLILWSLYPSNSILNTVHLGFPATHILWSPNNQFIAVLTAKYYFELVSVKTGQIPIASDHLVANPYDIKWSPTGDYLIIYGLSDGEGNTVRLMDVLAMAGIPTAPDQVGNYDGSNLKPYTLYPIDNNPSWSFDGNQFAVGDIAGAHIETPHGSPIDYIETSIGNYGTPNTVVAWSTDNQYLVWGGGQSEIWDLNNNSPYAAMS